MALPDFPIGDFDTYEDGDMADVLDVSDLDLEAGDISEDDLIPEMGAPTGAVGRLFAKMAANGRVKPSTLAALNKAKPRAAKLAVASVRARRASKTAWATYEYAEGARMINSSIGIKTKLQPYEVEAIQTHITEIQLVEPKVVSIPLVSGTGTLQIDNALVSSLGLANNTLFRYVGAKILFVASDLNRAPGGNITISRTIPNQAQAVSNIEIRGKNVTEFTFINAGIVAGKPRYYAPLITALTAASTLTPLVVSGVPTGYSAQLRFLVPGDQEVERFFRLL